MEFIETKLDGVYLLKPKVFGDNRGWFFESFKQNEFEENIGKIKFIQENHSFSGEKNTLRGMKFQSEPFAQSKLVRCVRGTVFDVVIDLRKSSKTYLQWLSHEISAENKLQIFIPKGFAHGFLTLEKNTEIIYKEDCCYSPQHEQIFKYNDQTFNINWNISSPIMSEKDRSAPTFNREMHSFV